MGMKLINTDIETFCFSYRSGLEEYLKTKLPQGSQADLDELTLLAEDYATAVANFTTAYFWDKVKEYDM